MIGKTILHYRIVEKLGEGDECSVLDSKQRNNRGQPGFRCAYTSARRQPLAGMRPQSGAQGLVARNA